MGDTKITIAVDGPSGAGKSSLSKLAAKEFGLAYVDTGAIYRTVALSALRGGFGDDDVSRLLDGLRIDVLYDENGQQQMLLNGEDVTGLLRSEEVSREASRFSVFAEVRDFLTDTQRNIARENDVIMEGRDIGTVVLPNAGLKIFITADSEERARRRYLELVEAGAEPNFDEVLKNLIERDEQDSRRDVAPLKAAPDAILLDTTGKTFEESAEMLFTAIRGRFEI